MEEFLVPLGKIRYHDDIRPALCATISDDGEVKSKFYFIISNFFLTGFSAQLWQHIKNGDIKIYNDLRDYTENFFTKEDLTELEIGLRKEIDYNMCYVTNNRTIANFGTVINDDQIPYEGDFTELTHFDTKNLKIIFDYIYNQKYYEYLTYINNLLLRTHDTIIYSSDIRNFKFRFIHRLNHFQYILETYLKPHDVLKNYLEEIFKCLKQELIYISNGKITVDRIEFKKIFDLIQKQQKFQIFRELTRIMTPIHKDKFKQALQSTSNGIGEKLHNGVDQKSPEKVSFLTNIKSFLTKTNDRQGETNSTICIKGKEPNTFHVITLLNLDDKNVDYLIKYIIYCNQRKIKILTIEENEEDEIHKKITLNELIVKIKEMHTIIEDPKRNIENLVDDFTLTWDAPPKVVSQKIHDFKSAISNTKDAFNKSGDKLSFISHYNAHYGGKKSRKRNSKKFKKRKTKRKSKKSKKRKSTKRRRHTKRRR